VASKVQFARTGGFTGIPLKATIDVDALPESQRQRLLELVAQSGFFELPQRIAAPAPIPDRFKYIIAIDMEQRHHVVDIDEVAAPPKLRPLLQMLTLLAQSGRKA
jgi:Emfourin